MTKRSIWFALVSLALLLGGSPANAAEKVGQWYTSLLAAGNWVDRDRALDDGLGYQVGVGKAVFEKWNIEGYLEGMSLDGAVKTDFFGFSVNANWLFFRDNRISPFIILGAGLIEENPDGQLSDRDFTGTYGLGFLIDAVRGGRIAFRTEVRSRLQFDELQTFEDLVVTFGIQIPFGQPRTGD